jgi:hypothetical protein
MTATDWTAFELLAEGWEKLPANPQGSNMYQRGVALCAKQLRETIARAKADKDEDEDLAEDEEPEPGGATSAWEHHRHG